MKKFNSFLLDPLILISNKALLSLPTPSSISFFWNIGFLLGIILVFQIITGFFLSISYIPHTSLAFDSVIHIIRDIDFGWIFRYLHINGASLFFIFLYLHIGRGIYFNSPRKRILVWFSGIFIFLLTIGASFLGYVLPWGQISYWGATVITRILTAIPYIGLSITEWLWGNFSVSQPTLNRFFSFHFFLPIAIVALVLIHLIFLHEKGSSNPLGLETDRDKVIFSPLFFLKDLISLLFSSFLLILVINICPNVLGDVENFNISSTVVTPPHIQPEWYFLFAYAILRSIPSKVGGVVAIVFSIFILSILMFRNKKFNNKHNFFRKIIFWFIVRTFLLLTWVGGNPVEDPFILLGQFLTFSYFFSFFII